MCVCVRMCVCLCVPPLYKKIDPHNVPFFLQNLSVHSRHSVQSSVTMIGQKISYDENNFPIIITIVHTRYLFEDVCISWKPISATVMKKIQILFLIIMT